MLSKILAAVDGTPASRDAAALAGVLADATRADLELVGVFPDPLLAFPVVLGSSDHPERYAKAMLADVRQSCAPNAHTATVPDFSTARALRRLARVDGPDLLVLGSCRHAAAGRVRTGRTARQILRAASCPVLVAAAGLHEQPVALRHIVVGVDGSPESRAALAFAQTIASHIGASVSAVVVADDRLPVPATEVGMLLELQTWEEIVEEQRTVAVHLLDELVGDDPAVQRIVRAGDPVQELSDAAAGADLLVIGSRRWGTIERIAIGSTGEDLSHDAPCSLLVVPRPAEVPEARVEEVQAEAAT